MSATTTQPAAPQGAAAQSVLSALDALCQRLRAALGAQAVVNVHTQDLSDAHTGKWLLRLPGVYLLANRLEARAPNAARLHLTAYVLVRQTDAQARQAQLGWQLAEAAWAALATEALVQNARLRQLEQSALPQAAVGVWEITLERRHHLAAPPEWDDARHLALGNLHSQSVLASQVPWVGTAHEAHYRVLDAAQGGAQPLPELLP